LLFRNTSKWEEEWRLEPAAPIDQAEFSSCGRFFATCGLNDCALKVWYRDEGANTHVVLTNAFSWNQLQGLSLFCI